jgi:hypothetical protein
MYLTEIIPDELNIFQYEALRRDVIFHQYSPKKQRRIELKEYPKHERKVLRFLNRNKKPAPKWTERYRYE